MGICVWTILQESLVTRAKLNACKSHRPILRSSFTFLVLDQFN